MEDCYVVKKRTVLYSGKGWQSKSEYREEWAIVHEPYGIGVKSFETEKEAIEYYDQKYKHVK